MVADDDKASRMASPLVRAARIQVRGVVQGVGFRPFVYRLARTYGVGGWVRNDRSGASLHVEGQDRAVDDFLIALEREAPPVARIDHIDVEIVSPTGVHAFHIQESDGQGALTAGIAPDLAVCALCLAELRDAANRRHEYAYINCTSCGPRYTIVKALPYDRSNTTMAAWSMCPACSAEYHEPGDRRFHAQPIACPACGPDYEYVEAHGVSEHVHDSWTDRTGSPLRGRPAIEAAAHALARGLIVAIKGLGGYHLACDARRSTSVWALRTRKYRKEQPFAVMARDMAVARSVAHLSTEAEVQLLDPSRPIVLSPASVRLDAVAPDNGDVGIMLPYTPLHHLLFAVGAPDLIVMTSGNRSSEPIAYTDDDALARLAGIADAWLVGERPIARRVDDSVVRVSEPHVPPIIRRARGLSPGAVARLPCAETVLALGGDLKNTVTLVIGGEAIVSQHVGDLAHAGARDAYELTIADLLAVYELDVHDVTVAYDEHPQYASTIAARALPARRQVAVQHHRAHIASVLAERGAYEAVIIGIALDGTGFGDDGSIWGGEIFAGSLVTGLRRVGHLREARLAGGDAAALHPVQAAAGFLAQLDHTEDLTGPPFDLPARYQHARDMVDHNVRCFATTSMGRLFDCIAALVGFTRPVTFEAQAAIWLEHLARSSHGSDRYLFPYRDGEWDFRPLLADVVTARRRGEAVGEIARATHRGIADGIVAATCTECDRWHTDTVVLSGGVCQNALLMHDVGDQLRSRGYRLWVNRLVPANDGGLSLGQAAYAAFSNA